MTPSNSSGEAATVATSHDRSTSNLKFTASDRFLRELRRRADAYFERTGRLVRIDQPVHARLEAAAIHRRVHAAGGPALLFANVTGCRFPMASNLFGTMQRVRWMFRDALAAVRIAAEHRGFRAEIVNSPLVGEARDVGVRVGAAARAMSRGQPFPPPGCLIFGGETTVTVRGQGRGGRNHELALGAALAIADAPGTAVFAFATDGLDGNSGAAGAVATDTTLPRAAAAGWSPAAAFEASDSAGFFAALGDQWRSGPTGTNVNDLALALAYPCN